MKTYVKIYEINKQGDVVRSSDMTLHNVSANDVRDALQDKFSTGGPPAAQDVAGAVSAAKAKQAGKRTSLTTTRPTLRGNDSEAKFERRAQT